MSVLFALLLAAGPVVGGYVQAAQWEEVAEQVAADDAEAPQGGEDEEFELLQGHSFHAVITAGISIDAPQWLPSAPQALHPAESPTPLRPQSLCTPSLLDYYCNIREYCIAPHAP